MIATMTVGGSGRRGGGGGVLFGLLPPLLLLLYCLLSIQAHAVPNAVPIAASANNQATQTPKQNLQQAQTCTRPPASPQSVQQHQRAVYANANVPIRVTQASSETLAAAANLVQNSRQRVQAPRGGGGGAAGAAGTSGGARQGEGAAHLAVSITGLHDVPSAVLSYGTIDLTNTHSTHALKIRSMETSPMLLVSERRSAGTGTGNGGSAGGMHSNTIDVASTIYQINISEFGDRVLTLGPGQSASFPISMYPAIPSDYLEHKLYGGPMEVPPSKAAAASAAAASESPSADELASRLNDWVEHRERTLEMAEQYEERRGLAADELQLHGGKSPTLLADMMELERGIDYSGQHDVAPAILSDILGGNSADSSAVPPSILHQQQTRQDPREWKQYVRSDRNLHSRIGPSLLSNPRLHVVLAHLHIEIDNIPEKLQAPIWATAVRTNPYGLPSTITFRPEPSQQSVEEGRDLATYTLYMVNPHADRDMIVYDVYTSNPAVIRIDRDDVSEDAVNPYPGNHRDVDEILRQKSPSGKFVYEGRITGGPVVLRPFEARSVGSVNLFIPIQISPEAEIDGLPDFLGYVHIRTSVGTMVVAVESAAVEFEETFETAELLVDVHGSGTILSEANGPPTFDRGVLKSAVEIVEDAESLSDMKLLSSSPAAVQFGLLSSPSEEAQFSSIGLNITNHAEETLRIMRVTIGIDGGNFGETNSSTTGISVEVMINGTTTGLGIGANTPTSAGDLVIPAGATLDGALSVICRPISNFGGDGGSNGRNMPQQFSGMIVIRATLASMTSYEEWRQVVARDPTANETNSVDHVLLEVPFKVDVFHGSLSYDASQTYFPVGMAARQSDGSDSKRNSQRIDIVNEFPFPLVFFSADIVGVDGASSKRCQMRFEILDFLGESHDGNFVFEVRHNDLVSTDGDMTPLLKDVQCGISLQMLFGSYAPVQFVVPLKTYDGRLATRLDHSYADTSDVKFLACEGSWQGNDRCISRWYQNTTLGQVLKEQVGDTGVNSRQQRRRKTKESSKLESLFEYLSQSQSSDPAPSEVDPVVLDLGTLPLSSRRSYSLLLTNPNPVPMEVSPDHGGSIEGMSIGLGKVRIDSLTLLKKGEAESTSNDPDSLFSEGARRFLLSSEPSRAFFGRLADSDDVFPATHQDCDLITPQLSELFYKHATITIRASSPDSPPSPPKSDVIPSANQGAGPPLMSCFDGGSLPGLDHDDECQSSSWFSRQKECGDQGAAGILLSDNGIKCFVKPATYNSTEASASISKKIVWYLPPASTARLDLTIITPPWSVLRRLSRSEGGTLSMLPFLSTGLVLRSSFGQAIPIIVTYQALLAELNAGATGGYLSMGSYVGEEETRIINDDHGPTGRLYHSRVDPTIVEPYPGALKADVGVGGDGDERRRTPLQIRSTLDDSFDIVRLSSCNPWFDFHLGESRLMKPKGTDPSVARDYRVYNSSAFSSIRCKESNFLSCLLLFLESRSSLQPAGCGLSEADAAREYAYSPELTWDNHRYEHILESLSTSAMVEGGGAFNLKTRKWNGIRMLDLAHARSHDIKVKDTTAANLDGKVHGDELQYAWQWLGVPFDYDLDVDEEESTQVIKSAAIDALQDASKRLLEMYSESASKLRLDRAEHPDKALVHTLDVKPFIDARETWKEVKEQKLHLMTGDVRATIEHKVMHSDENSIETFNTDIPLAVLWTYLDLPSIFDPRPQDVPNATYRLDWEGTGIIDFSLTALSDLKTLYVPVHNPSKIPIRVRLTTIKPFGPNETASAYSAKWDGVDHRAAWSGDDLYLFDKDISPLHVHSCTSDECSSDADRWWNGGAYYHVSGDGTTLKSRQNVTIKSNEGSYVLDDPSLHATSALVAGCGRRRCGLRDDQQQQAQPNQNEAVANFLKAPERLFSAMGAAAAKRVHLRGRIYDPVSGEESAESSTYKAERCLDWFSPSCPSVHDVVPPFAISMSSLQEEIVLAPNERAWLGPVYFRPSAASRFGSTVLIENSLTGIEPIKLTGVGATRQIAFEEAGGGDSNEATLEIRYGMPALMFPGTTSVTRPGKAVSHRVKVRNTGSLPVRLSSASLAPFSLSQVTQHPVSSFKKNDARGCSIGGFTLEGCDDGGYDEGYTLDPGEMGFITILHSPRCSMKKSFVVMNLDCSSKEAESFVLTDGEESQLLVGFDMSEEEMASCVPIHPSLTDKVRSVQKLFHQDHSIWNPFSWSDVIDREESSVWRQILLFAWPIILLVICIVYSVSIDRKVRLRFFSSTQIDINDLATSIAHDASTARILGVLQGTGESNQHRALYQLAQSDPNATDLAQAGRDQTRRLLLGKYRRVQAAMPRCLRPNGAFFFRGSAHPAAAGAAPTPEKDGAKIAPKTPRPARLQGSLADEIFGHSESSFSGEDDNAALPLALSWRGAATRGILPHPSRVSLGIGNRVGDLLKKREELRRESTYSNVVVAEAIAIVDDESEDDDSVPTTIIAPSNTAANEIIPSDSSAKATANKTQDDEKEDDIASLLPSTQKSKSTQKAPSQYAIPLPAPTSTESPIDTKALDGDWHVQAASNKKTPRDTSAKLQVAASTKRKPKEKEEKDQVGVHASSVANVEVPSAASTAASSAGDESKRPEVTKKTSRRNMKSDDGEEKKTAKKSQNGASKASDVTGKASKNSVPKQKSASSTEAVDSTKTKNITEKSKSLAKTSKTLEATEKKTKKADKAKAREKKAKKADKGEEVEKKGEGADAPSAPAGTTSRQTKKKQKEQQRQQQQQQQQQQIAADTATTESVADSSSSSKKKKKKSGVSEKRRNSLGATTNKQSSPATSSSKKPKAKASMEREDSAKRSALTPSSDSEFAKSVPNIRPFDGSNPSTPEVVSVAPPPGIAPPPGFLSDLPTKLPEDASLSNLSHIPLDGGTGAPSGLGGLGGTELWLGGNASSPLGRDNHESLSGLGSNETLRAPGGSDALHLGDTLPLLDQASPGFLRGRPLLGGGGGFNVQSFLDTILDESEVVADDYDDDGGREGGVGGSPLALGSGPDANDGLADAIATATAIGGHTSDLLVPQRLADTGVSNDPWSAPNLPSLSALPTAPLLTPEQILQENEAADAEEKNKKEEDGSHLMALFGTTDGEDK